METPESSSKLNRLLWLSGAMAAMGFLAILGFGYWIYSDRQAEAQNPHPMYRTLTPEEYKERTPPPLEN